MFYFNGNLALSQDGSSSWLSVCTQLTVPRRACNDCLLMFPHGHLQTVAGSWSCKNSFLFNLRRYGFNSPRSSKFLLSLGLQSGVFSCISVSLFFFSLLTPYGVFKTVSPNHIPFHEVWLFCLFCLFFVFDILK